MKHFFKTIEILLILYIKLSTTKNFNNKKKNENENVYSFCVHPANSSEILS